MAETKKAKKYFYHTSPAANFQGTWPTSNISLGAEDEPYTDVAGETYDGQKFVLAIEKVMLSEMSKEEIANYFQERWNLSLDEMFDQWCTFAFTKPSYKTLPDVKKLIDAGDLEGAHVAAQKAIDEYRFNVRKERVTVSKAEAQEVKGLKALAAKLNISFEELCERAAQMETGE